MSRLARTLLPQRRALSTGFAAKRGAPALKRHLNASPDPLARLMEGNKRWAEQLKKEAGFPDKYKTHKPSYLWIGCADARVPPNMILGGEAPGQVFVHRNVANLVVSTDANLMSVIQYGVLALKIPDIIVCGHYECGGVKAAMTANDHAAPLEAWIRNVRDVIRLNKDELMAIKDETARYRKLIDINTVEQAVNVMKCEAVQKSLKQTGALPRVHAVVYDPLTGELKKLEVDSKKSDAAVDAIYKLYA